LACKNIATAPQQSAKGFIGEFWGTPAKPGEPEFKL